VDDLEKCSSMVGNEQKQILATKLHSNISSMQPTRKKIAGYKKYYPFKQGYLAIAILRVGAEGIHMTVDGKHVTSFAFRKVSLYEKSVMLLQFVLLSRKK
jgi:beta-1,3-galactosyltransferase